MNALNLSKMLLQTKQATSRLATQLAKQSHRENREEDDGGM